MRPNIQLIFFSLALTVALFAFSGLASADSCDYLDGWYNSGSPYPCCQGQESCSCQPQQYLDYYLTCTAWGQECTGYQQVCTQTSTRQVCEQQYTGTTYICHPKTVCLPMPCQNVTTYVNVCNTTLIYIPPYCCGYTTLRYCSSYCSGVTWFQYCIGDVVTVCTDTTFCSCNQPGAYVYITTCAPVPVTTCVPQPDFCFPDCDWEAVPQYQTVCHTESYCSQYSQQCAGWTPVCAATGCASSATGSRTLYNSCSLVDGQCGYEENHPPAAPVIPVVYQPTGVTWNNCSFQDKSIPTFHWTYFDSDGDAQAAYEIWIDTNPNFNDPKFNNAVNIASTDYTLDLSNDDEGDWLSALEWNTVYRWKVRVQDSHGAWSSWSDTFSFTTPVHAYPWPGFTWAPQDPRREEVVIFDPEENDVDYLWTVTEGAETYTDGTSPTSRNPHIKFSTLENKIKLRVTDSVPYSCESAETAIETTLPLPQYEEIPPISWLKNVLSGIGQFIAF